ncbi:MAG: signal peptidase II [Actinomycetota bacterium]
MSGIRLARAYLTLLGVGVVVAVLDQVTKQLALDHLMDGPIDIIEGAVSLNLTFNAGGAFGLLPGLPGFFLIATIVVVAVILMMVRRLENHSWTVPLGMVLGGGLGNLYDRLFRDFDGRVVDFVDLHVWPVFNLADSAIVVGAALLLILGARHKESEEPEESA